MANTARARVYSDVNVHRPREYWDYESHVIEWGWVCCITVDYVFETGILSVKINRTQDTLSTEKRKFDWRCFVGQANVVYCPHDDDGKKIISILE